VCGNDATVHPLAARVQAWGRMPGTRARAAVVVVQ
jgi:hypothetical protein